MHPSVHWSRINWTDSSYFILVMQYIDKEFICWIFYNKLPPSPLSERWCWSKDMLRSDAEGDMHPSVHWSQINWTDTSYFTLVMHWQRVHLLEFFTISLPPSPLPPPLPSPLLERWCWSKDMLRVICIPVSIEVSPIGPKSKDPVQLIFCFAEIFASPLRFCFELNWNWEKINELPVAPKEEHDTHFSPTGNVRKKLSFSVDGFPYMYTCIHAVLICTVEQCEYATKFKRFWGGEAPGNAFELMMIRMRMMVMVLMTITMAKNGDNDDDNDDENGDDDE